MDSSTNMTALTSAISTVLELAGTVLNTILANPVLALFFALGIVGLIIGVVSKLKHV